MKRAGKLFLVIVLVLAMVWTSTGTSNVMSVFAENLTSAQSVEEDKEEAKTNTEEKNTGTEKQKESKQESSEKENKKEEEAAESTTASKAKEETTAKKEETTKQEATTKKQEKTSEATTSSKKKSAAKQDTSTKENNTKEQEAVQQEGETGTPVATEISLNKYIHVDTSGIWITVNGQKETLKYIQDKGIKVPKGSPVEIKFSYSEISNITENTKLVYQIPDGVTIPEEQSGDVIDGKITAGTYKITTDGKVTIILNKSYLEDRQGKIDGGTFVVDGKFKNDWGGTPGGDKIIFGETEVTIPFEENQVVTKANLSVKKQSKGYNKADNTITYEIKVNAPSDNTQDIPDVTVDDTFTTNGDKLVASDGKKYEIVDVPEGTTFDAKTGKWTVGTVKPGASYTLKYKVKVDSTFFNDMNAVKQGIKNKATAYSGTTKMGDSSVTQSFNNTLNIEKSKGSGVIIDSATGKTYVDYKVTVTAPDNNATDMTNVRVEDVFRDFREQVKNYSNIKVSKGTAKEDNTTKSLNWTIGTMKPGEKVELTYRAELKDDVWEDGTGSEVNKTIKNQAKVKADGMNDKDAWAEVNLHKVWIWKNGNWEKDSKWSNGQGTGRMHFTIHANESTYGGPVLDKNFTFKDKLSGNYVYDGKVIVKIYNQGPQNKGNPVGSAEFDVDGQTEWTYTPTGSMSGKYYYEFEYYARPAKNGHGGPISNKAGIGVGDGSSFNHETIWKGTGSNEYSLKKEYLGGVGTGAAKWKTTIPSNVYAGTKYVDTLSDYQTFTQEQLKAIVVTPGKGAAPFVQGTDYTVAANVNGQGKITGFTLVFNTDTENITTSNPITIEYESTPDLSGIKAGASRTFENTGRIYYSDDLYLTAKANTTYTQYADISKTAGDYNSKTKQITWYITLNENSKMTGDATVMENLPDGLKFIRAEISERGSEAGKTAISVDDSTKDTKNVKINVTNLVSNNERNRNGYIKIKVITEVTDEDFLQSNSSKQFTNSAELKFGTDEGKTATAITTISNTALSKEGIHNSKTYPYVKYTIKMNPNGYNLLEQKDSVNVVDQMTEDMILMEDSVEVSSNGQTLSSNQWTLSNDKENHRFTVTVPDDIPITITYKVSINKPAGEKVSLSNRAWYEGHENSGSKDERNITVMDSSATVTGSLLLYVKKKDALTKTSLSGADFVLAEVVRNSDGSIAYENGEPKLANEVSGTTDADGEATFQISQKTGGDKLYCLYEKKAPENYKKSDRKVYVAFKAQKNTGNLSIQYVQNGGSVEMMNMPTGGLTVEKKVIGNKIPEESYQMEVTAAESNEDKDLTKATVTDAKDKTEIKASASTAGTLTFSLKAGQKAEVSGLPVGTYSVKENVANRGADDKEAYTAAYSDGNEAVKVVQGQKANVTVTNTYKTELYILKKDAGADTVLSGAELAVYKASDVTNGKVNDGAKAVASWTSGATPQDLTGKVEAGESYVLVETKAPADYETAAAIPFTVNAEGKISVTGNNAKYYDDQTHTITLDNQKKKGTLSVKKIIEDGEEKTAFDFTVTFTNFNNGRGGDVTVTRNGKDTTATVAADGKLEIKGLTNNETVKISGIPYGTSYKVEETQQEEYLATESEGLTGTIGDGESRETDAQASITNTKLTGFVVKKTVVNGQYTPDAETKDNKQFKFKVTLTRKGRPYTGKFTLQYSDKEQGEEVTAQNGIVNITLKDTQSAAFSNLPSGLKYTVEEEADADYTASVSVNGKVAQSADDGADKAATAASGTIDKNGDTVEFTNTRKLGAFSFTKTVKGNTQDKEQAYIFDVQVDGKAFSGKATITQASADSDENADNETSGAITVTDGKISLKDGQTAIIENIPSGVSYSVKEETGDRYVTIIDEKITAEKTGTVETEKTSETQVVNQVIHLNVTKTDITGTSEVAGATMKLYKAEDVNEDGTVKDGAEALDSWTSEEGGYHDFGPSTKAGESYVLIETAAPDGYAYAENILFTVKEDGTIETKADKKTNEAAGEDVYLVKDDVTKVSIKKTDITGSKEIAGAKLLLKDKDGNVIESWTSATEAHVFEKKLIAGETYTLVEVTAPSGYEVTENITFTVNKDGTVSVDGKTVDGNEVIMKDETTPVGEEGRIVVSKLVTFQGKNQAVNRTFYTALFSDADCTKKVSDVKELRCEGAWSAYVVFEHLKNGTYYVAETDENGDKLESSEVCKIVGNGTECKITPTQKTAYAVLENQVLQPGDDFLNTVHNLTVTKNVTRDGEPISDKYNGTFYVSLFTDPYYTNRTGDVKELKVKNGESTSVSFLDLVDGTYYVAETDKDGNPVENSDFDFDVTYDGDIEVSFTESNKDSSLGITNDMTKNHPDYEKYLEEDDDDDDDKDHDGNKKNNNSSNSTTKKSSSSKTGDNSHIAFYSALAVAALAAAGAETYRRSRKGKKGNKHNR